MDKERVAPGQAYRLLNPGPVVIVSVGDGADDNLFSVTWVMPVRKSPGMVALLSGKRHYSWDFIARTGELGINIPEAAVADAVLGCGSVSGRKEPDKFSRFGLSRQPARQIKAPLVAECVANLECRVAQVHDMGASALVVAQILEAVAHPDHFRDGSWAFDRGLELIHHLGGSRFAVSPSSIAASLARDER